ncbi:unnamed protein product, partial [Nesidiocoris tenuis]
NRGWKVLVGAAAVRPAAGVRSHLLLEEFLLVCFHSCPPRLDYLALPCLALYQPRPPTRIYLVAVERRSFQNSLLSWESVYGNNDEEKNNFQDAIEVYRSVCGRNYWRGGTNSTPAEVYRTSHLRQNLIGVWMRCYHKIIMVLEQESAIKIFCPSAVRRTPYAVRRTPYAVRRTPYAVRHSSSIHSDEDTYDELEKPRSAYNTLRPLQPGTDVYRPVATQASPTGGQGYCAANMAQANVYGGTSACKVQEPLYGGTKSMYCKSPPLTRANLNRSQSVYSKSTGPPMLHRTENGPPRPGPLVPAQSLYPMRLNSVSSTGTNTVATNQNAQNQQRLGECLGTYLD